MLNALFLHPSYFLISHPPHRTNQSEQRSVSSIWNQTCFGLWFNNHLLYGFVYVIHFHSKCMCQQKSIYEKRLTNYVYWVKLWLKVTAFWNIDRTVKSTMLYRNQNIDRTLSSLYWYIRQKLYLLHPSFTYIIYDDWI